MSFNVVPFGSSPEPANGSAADPAHPPTEVDRASPVVVELASRRRAESDVPEIPDTVWDEVEAASRLWRELRAQGREVRFDADAATGRVVPSLCDLNGGVVCPLPLRDAVDIADSGPDGPSAA